MLRGLTAEAHAGPDSSKDAQKTYGNSRAIPQKQRAVQLVGPDQLTLNESKPVFEPGPHQVLGRSRSSACAFPI